MDTTSMRDDLGADNPKGGCDFGGIAVAVILCRCAILPAILQNRGNTTKKNYVETV
jgi:hypothetical protein